MNAVKHTNVIENKALPRGRVHSRLLVHTHKNTRLVQSSHGFTSTGMFFSVKVFAVEIQSYFKRVSCKTMKIFDQTLSSYHQHFLSQQRILHV